MENTAKSSQLACDGSCHPIGELIHAKDFNQAIGMLKALAVRCPNCRMVHEMKGDIAYLMGDYRAAREEYSKAISKSNPLSGLYLKRAFACMAMEDLWGAQEDLELAGSLGSTDAKKFINNFNTKGRYDA